MRPAPSEDALRQLRLRYRLGAVVADAYFEEGFTVALEDVIAGEMLREYVGIVRSRPLHVVVLLPSLAAVRTREDSRAAGGYRHWPIDDLYDLFSTRTPRLGVWLDTTQLTPEQTVDQILEQTRSCSG